MAVKIDVFRTEFRDISTPGKMSLDGVFECHTLEPARDRPVFPGHPCIPAGEYAVALTESPHFGYVTPEVLAVPGRSHIRIHRANWPRELLGCTGVGQQAGKDEVLRSEAAFDVLMRKLGAAVAKGEKITAEWHDPLP